MRRWLSLIQSPVPVHCLNHPGSLTPFRDEGVGSYDRSLCCHLDRSGEILPSAIGLREILNQVQNDNFVARNC